MQRVLVAGWLELAVPLVGAGDLLALGRHEQDDRVAVDPPRALERHVVTVAFARRLDADLERAIARGGEVHFGLVAARAALQPLAAETHDALVDRGRLAIQADRRAE